MEHQPGEVSYEGEKVTARCSCGAEFSAEGSAADAEARAAVIEHIVEVSE